MKTSIAQIAVFWMRVTGWSFRYCVNVMCVLRGGVSDTAWMYCACYRVEFQILRECNMRVSVWIFRFCVNVMCVFLCGFSDTAWMYCACYCVDFQILRECNVRVTGWTYRFCVTTLDRTAMFRISLWRSVKHSGIVLLPIVVLQFMKSR